MAAKRIAKSAVDWAAFAERVPPNQKDAFRAFKSKSDLFVARVHKHPENVQPIDFAAYAAKLGNVPFLAEFEKAYKSLSIDYPKDKNNLRAAVSAEEKQAAIETKERIADAQRQISEAKAMLSKIDQVPNPESMTMEMYADYFPDKARNPWDRPAFYPHTRGYQPENDPHTCK